MAVPAVRTHGNPDGSVTVWVDRDGDGVQDPGDPGKTVPAVPPVPMPIRTVENPDGATTVYADWDGDGVRDADEPSARVPPAADVDDILLSGADILVGFVVALVDIGVEYVQDTVESQHPCGWGGIDRCIELLEDCNPLVRTTCGPLLQAVLIEFIQDCSTVPPGRLVYVCFGNGQGLVTRQLGLRTLVVGLPTGGAIAL